MKQAKVLTELEIKRVLAVAADGRHAARNRLAIMLSHYAGLRVGEIASLKVTSVLDREGQVRDQFTLEAVHTKTNDARTVYVGDRLKRELKRYLSSLESLPLPDAPLLQTQRHTAFSANTLCQLFSQLYRKAGLDDATSHSGRRYFITKLAHAGVSAKVIMTLAGHKHLSTTQRYVEVNDEMLRKAVELI